ncbi:hypothetical protein TNCT_434091, partial [Trichonephila clavata]
MRVEKREVRVEESVKVSHWKAWGVRVTERVWGVRVTERVWGVRVERA